MEIGSYLPIILVVLALVVILNAIKAVPQGMEYTVEQFGRYTKTLKPGLSFIIPFFEKVGYKMNMRERVIDIPCLLYTSPSPRDLSTSRMPSSA